MHVFCDDNLNKDVRPSLRIFWTSVWFIPAPALHGDLTGSFTPLPSPHIPSPVPKSSSSWCTMAKDAWHVISTSFGHQKVETETRNWTKISEEPFSCPARVRTPRSRFGDIDEGRWDRRLHQLELVVSLGAATVVFPRQAENMDSLGWVLGRLSSEQETPGETSTWWHP